MNTEFCTIHPFYSKSVTFITIAPSHERLSSATQSSHQNSVHFSDLLYVLTSPIYVTPPSTNHPTHTTHYKAPHNILLTSTLSLPVCNIQHCVLRHSVYVLPQILHSLSSKCKIIVLYILCNLRRADHSSRGVLPSVVCLRVIMTPR